MTSKNQTYPSATFTFSPVMEARRVLHLAASLTHGFYQKHGFLVLPHVTPKVPTGIVIIPDIPYTTIPDFWSRVTKLKLTTPIVAPDRLIKDVEKLLRVGGDSTAYERHTAKLEEEWNSIEKTFWSNLFTLFPTYRKSISRITVYSTKYGPYTTFNLARGNGSNLTIYVRQDSSIDRLVWTILMCLFRPKMQDDMHYTWEEMEATVDWLMSESTLCSGLPFHHPTIKNLRSDQVAHFRRMSEKYLTSLGFSQATAWKKVGPTIHFGDTPLVGLSAHEQKLLEVLFAKRGETVTYDEIADTLWPNGENFSLFAISKEIERLRKKIRAAGIHSPVLHAHRKIGYSLI